MQQMVHISKGQNLDSSISLFRANGDDTSANQKDVLILQDAFMDNWIHFSICNDRFSWKGCGDEWEDSSRVALLPSGIAIVPDYYQDFSKPSNCINIFGKKVNGFNRSTGSLVTIGFQVLVQNSK
ncbi:hypothetical protein T459_01794 [Capsicum annuum]|uniref:HD-Zip IV C-terminal domain-containing protein n=1 Tax=Capsicum annuum TaxID=4072 RepID=A0A2G3AI52_CAPAN|nr:hypothetical protein T459_01794 [Capsicum annuum]